MKPMKNLWSPYPCSAFVWTSKNRFFHYRLMSVWNVMLCWMLAQNICKYCVWMLHLVFAWLLQCGKVCEMRRVCVRMCTGMLLLAGVCGVHRGTAYNCQLLQYRKLQKDSFLITRWWRTFSNETIHNLNTSPVVIMMMRSRRVRWIGSEGGCCSSQRRAELW
jgi:hypothetical protein